MKVFELLPKPLGNIFRKLTHFTCNSPSASTSTRSLKCIRLKAHEKCIPIREATLMLLHNDAPIPKRQRCCFSEGEPPYISFREMQLGDRFPLPTFALFVANRPSLLRV